MRKTWTIAAALALALPSAAQAEVSSSSDTGFVVSLGADIAAPRSDVWKTLVWPARWWSSDHTYSGDAANLYIDAQATGCFCEKLPKPADAPADQRMGSVEHMHVVYADPQSGVLRMVGGLGPLQGEPVSGVWTITLKDNGKGGTRVEWDYAVTGLLRVKGGDIAKMVDMVMGQQLQRLGQVFDPAAPAVG